MNTCRFAESAQLQYVKSAKLYLVETTNTNTISNNFTLMKLLPRLKTNLKCIQKGQINRKTLVSLSFIQRISFSVRKAIFKNLLCIESNLWSLANQIRKAERSNKRKIMALSGILYQQHQPLTYCSDLPHKHSSETFWILLFGST